MLSYHQPPGLPINFFLSDFSFLLFLQNFYDHFLDLLQKAYTQPPFFHPHAVTLYTTIHQCDNIDLTSFSDLPNREECVTPKTSDNNGGV
jgi:hypothetical protein